MKFIYFFLFVSILSIASCGSDDEGDQLNTDIQLIEQYLLDNQLTAQKTESGLHYIVTNEGSGGHPTIQSTVKMRYTGYFLDGTIFDQAVGSNSIEYPLSVFIPGWIEGIPKFQKGGEGMLLIPSKLGYGDQPPPGIPPNSVLLFDIELIDFN